MLSVHTFSCLRKVLPTVSWDGEYAAKSRRCAGVRAGGASAGAGRLLSRNMVRLTVALLFLDLTLYAASRGLLFQSVSHPVPWYFVSGLY